MIIGVNMDKAEIQIKNIFLLYKKCCVRKQRKLNI